MYIYISAYTSIMLAPLRMVENAQKFWKSTMII